MIASDEPMAPVSIAASAHASEEAPAVKPAATCRQTIKGGAVVMPIIGWTNGACPRTRGPKGMSRSFAPFGMGPTSRKRLASGGLAYLCGVLERALDKDAG
mmetsp:Transcript_81469/g.154020  ORF Transcript_81469/g.154020 Transcript_81469/m.154020 type:complete len:101 (+) Transcript_81469:112-414(+)